MVRLQQQAEVESERRQCAEKEASQLASANHQLQQDVQASRTAMQRLRGCIHRQLNLLLGEVENNEIPIQDDAMLPL